MEITEHYPFQEDVYKQLQDIAANGEYMAIGMPSRFGTIISLEPVDLKGEKYIETIIQIND
ncbi:MULTISPECIES: hypothetical protein [Bacillus cereus group]|uniref:hypothetical protein n=1 Tax=Bacillus cereus group TaxID=86661 RepID=UPI001298D2FE|nr:MULTISPECIES: hypothetical protein [Bacillus cereus group]MEB9419962.1 hypothetical protein [Bacillus cereus]MEB9509445.1 hypothetical protein [Bacillus cereus]MEB9561541.1 hypothetical protein [Bacillus cereus]MRC02861.1 hypothetical protein [Bacillus thuringiensis]MRC76551.1 hypothetical protein [Bacillus thuringiensis]